MIMARKRSRRVLGGKNTKIGIKVKVSGEGNIFHAKPHAGKNQPKIAIGLFSFRVVLRRPCMGSRCAAEYPRTPHDFEKISEERNTRKAKPLSTLLTACSFPQRASKRSASAERRSNVGLSSRLLVGDITMSVNGMTDPSSTPATSHQTVAPASHAAMDDRRPTAASVACMMVALR